MTETTATTGTSTSPVAGASADDSAIPAEVGVPPGPSGGSREPSGGSREPERPPATLAGAAGQQALPLPDPDGAAGKGVRGGQGQGTGGGAGRARSGRPDRPSGSAARPDRASGSAAVPRSDRPSGSPGSPGSGDSARPGEAARAGEATRPGGAGPWLGGAAGTFPVPEGGPAGPPPAGGSLPAGAGPRPSYTRPAGMAPPPDQLGGAESAGETEAAAGVPAAVVLSAPPASAYAAAAPVSAPPVSAPPRVTGRAAAGGVTVRPIGAGGTGTAVGAAAVTERVRPRPAATPRGPRRARLGVKRIDPWSMMKFSFAVSLVMFIVVIVAASVLYLALDAMGVFESINSTVAELVDAGGGETGATFQITARGVIGTAAVLGALNVLLFTSLATLGAFIYNVCADLVGGVEVTLAERD